MAKRPTKASAAVGAFFAACREPCEDLTSKLEDLHKHCEDLAPMLEEGSNPLLVQEPKIRIMAGSTVVEVPRPSMPTKGPLPGALARDGGLSTVRSPSVRLPSVPTSHPLPGLHARDTGLSKVHSPVNQCKSP